MEVAVIVIVMLVTEVIDILHTKHIKRVQSRTEAQKRHRTIRDQYIVEMSQLNRESKQDANVA